MFIYDKKLEEAIKENLRTKKNISSLDVYLTQVLYTGKELPKEEQTYYNVP